MAGTISRGYTFGSTETVTNAKLHALVDDASISGIIDSDIAADANISSSKINFNLSDYVTLAGAQTITGAKTFDTTTTFNTPLANTNIAAITQASKVAGSSFYALASCVSGAGRLPAQNVPLIDSLLPSQTDNSGKFLTTNGTNASWGTVASSGYSNVVYQWNGFTDGVTGNANLVTATTDGLLSAPGTSNYIYFVVASTSSSYRDILRGKFVKTAGISTITINARMWAKTTSASKEAILKVDIGGLNNTVKTATSNTPTWVTPSTIDVSSLTNGTTYDITISMTNETSSNPDTDGYSYLSNIVLTGS